MRFAMIALLLGGLLSNAELVASNDSTTPALTEDTAKPGYTNLPQAISTDMTGTDRTRGKQKFGPPPPGYWRIVGGAVPNWRPDQVYATPRANPWTFLGPKPIEFEYWSGSDDASGRVVGVAPHATNANTVYICSASGGVWKTTNGGITWTPMSDELSTLNHGSIAVDPLGSDTVYVGTGEYTTNTQGDGLFKSIDGGLTWVRVATTGTVGDTCSKVIVHPANNLHVHVTGGKGYIRSQDGGNSWSTRLSGSASDVAVDPVDPNVIYVAMHGDGVYRSTNGGTSFGRLSGGLPAVGADFHRILIDVSVSNPQVLYAALIDGSAGLYGFYKSTDGGSTWTEKTNTPNFPSPQGWYDAFVGVDPTNENVVYAGGVSPIYAPAGVIKTTNGGNSWTEISEGNNGVQLHPDQHDIAFGPTGTVWVGNDGGVWKSNDGGANWTNTNATLSVTQNYQIALNPDDPNDVIGGTQDNGTVERQSDSLVWPQIVAGDGGFAAYDFADPTRRYTTYVRLTIFRLDSGGFANITGPWDPYTESTNFIAPLVMDPSNSNTLYGGTNRVWRTTNASTGADWSVISTFDLGPYDALSSIAVAPSNPSVVYAGSNDGRMFYYNGFFWYDRSAGLPFDVITDINIDPTDPTVLYVTIGNTTGGRVLRGDFNGSIWTDITGTLPNGVAAYALEVDWRFTPPYLYVGTGAGIYESANEGATWIKDGADLPNVNIGDLRIDLGEGTITAGTYGRGAWRKALEEPLLLGDMNCDGVVDFGDINPFVLALVDPANYPIEYPGCDIMHGDLDQDGSVGFGDINPFVDLLVN